MTPSEENAPDEAPVPDKSQTLAWRLFRALASLQLAVVLIAALTILLAWATFVESHYNAKAAGFGIYGTWWFGLLGALLALNIFCAAAIRFPWKKRQTGFVITHVGLLVLLGGCLVTRFAGIDARPGVGVIEGMSSSRVYEDTMHFDLEILPKEPKEDRQSIIVPFRSGPFNWSDYGESLLPRQGELFWFPWQLTSRDQGVLYDQDGITLEVLDYCADSKPISIPRIVLEVEGWSKSRRGMMANRSQKVSLHVARSGPHGKDLKYGVGSREVFSDGRILFWMTGDENELEAFRQSKPEEPLGGSGQIVLYTGGNTYRFSIEDFQKEPRKPLGDTGIEIELVGLEPQMLSATFEVRGPGKPQPMKLFADMPEFNRHDYRNGVFGTYWYDTSQHSPESEEPVRRGPAVPRIDILQGPDGKLFYRAWRSSKLAAIAELPTDGREIVAFADSPNADSPNKMTFRVLGFIPSEKPGDMIIPRPFDKDREDKGMTARRARLRLTVDGHAEEFWLKGHRIDPTGLHGDMNEYKTVEGEDRRVKVSMSRDEFDLGFEVFLHKFEMKLDPGTSQPSHYSSLVDFVEVDQNGQEQRQEDVLINMNQPKDFSGSNSGRSYRLFQSSYRGPWRREDPDFHKLVDDSDYDREKLWLSWLSVNYDPGRGLKYLGCLLIVVGIAVMYYMNLRSRRARQPAASEPSEK